MSLQLIETPYKVMNPSVPELEQSKWSAVWHPVMWKFQRQDFTIIDIQASGSFTQISAAGDFTAELAALQSIFVNSDNGNQYGSFLISSFNYDGTNTNIIYNNLPGTSMASTGYANLTGARSFYLIEIAIFDYASGTPVLITTDYGQFRPDSEGNIKADLQSWLQSTLSLKSQFDYVARTDPSRYLGHRYDIHVREYWKELGYTSWLADNALNITSGVENLSSHYVTNSAKQIGDLYGQNMAEYVMWKTNDTFEHAKGKFTTRFKTPVFFQGHPFDLAFCYDAQISSLPNPQRLAIVEVQKDVNGNVVATTEDMIDDNNEILNRATLAAVYNDTPYPSNVKTIDFYLKAKVLTGGTDPNLFFQPSFTVNGGFVFLKSLIPGHPLLATAAFNTDWPTTFNDFVNNINGNISNPVHPSDNSLGFTAAYNVSTNTITITAPSLSGATYNGASITINPYPNYVGWSVIPSATQTLSGGVDGTYTDAVGLTTAVVSEIKTIEVNDDCADNDVYLRWAIPTGGYDYWLFKRSQKETDVITAEQTFEKYIENLEDENLRAQVISKEAQTEIVLSQDGLTTDQALGLRYLLSEVVCDMYVPNELSDTSINFSWLGMRVKPASFLIRDTFDNRHSIELTLMPPARYNQQQ